MAPDEVPYLLDLHLFLGRSITLAQPHEEPSGEGRLGRTEVPMEFTSRQGCDGLTIGAPATVSLETGTVVYGGGLGRCSWAVVARAGVCLCPRV